MENEYYAVFKVDRPLFTYVHNEGVMISQSNDAIKLTLASDVMFDTAQKAINFIKNYDGIGILTIQVVYVVGL